MKAAIRSGGWVNAPRLRIYSAIMLGALLGMLGYLLLTSQGLNDARGKPIGTDYSNVYAAGSYALEGGAAKAYFPDWQHARQREIFGAQTPFYGWHYPPYFLLLASLLALMPYAASLVVWQAASLALYLRGLWNILPQRAMLLPAVAFPAVFINFGHGHNGLLTAALLALGLGWLKTKPILAGVMLGLLVYKPQFGVLIPLALIAGGYWRTFFAASGTVLGLSAVVTLVYGVGIWDAFIGSLEFTRQTVLEAGGTGFHKMQSIFAAVRMWGGSVELAYSAQATLLFACAAGTLLLWRRRVAVEWKYAGLVIASLLATPYSMDYDMVALAPALLWIVRHGLREGFGDYEKTLLALAWAMPLFARSLAEAWHLPLGLLSLLLLYALVLRRARVLR